MAPTTFLLFLTGILLFPLSVFHSNRFSPRFIAFTGILSFMIACTSIIMMLFIIVRYFLGV